MPAEPCILHSISGLVCIPFSFFLSPFPSTLVLRGLIGPTRLFGEGALYHPELYAIIFGAFLPVPFWLWQRRYPNSWVKFVSTPVLLNGVNAFPLSAGINYSAWFATGFVFQYLIRKRNFAWWSKFNYVTSAALDSGACLHVVVSAFNTVLTQFKQAPSYLLFLSFSRCKAFPLIGGGIRCTKIVCWPHYSSLCCANDLCPFFFPAADYSQVGLKQIPLGGIPLG